MNRFLYIAARKRGCRAKPRPTSRNRDERKCSRAGDSGTIYTLTATENKLSFWQRWMRRPQGTWLRRATLQIHLWTGIIIGVYVVVVCASGSAVVFRNDIYNTFES